MACRRGCVLLRTHLLGRNSIRNPSKLIRPMSSFNVVDNEKGHFPLDTLALLKKLKAKGVPSEHAQKTIEVIKEDLILSRFRSELKGVQEVIKNYLDMSELEPEVNNEASLKVLLKGVQERIEESKANLDSSKFKSEIELLDGIKDILHLSDEKAVMKDQTPLTKEQKVTEKIKATMDSGKFKSKFEPDEIIEDIPDEKDMYQFEHEWETEAKEDFSSEVQFEPELKTKAKENLDSSQFKSDEEKRLLEEIQANLTEANGVSTEKAQDYLNETRKSSMVNSDLSQFKSEKKTEAKGALEIKEIKSPFNFNYYPYAPFDHVPPPGVQFEHEHEQKTNEEVTKEEFNLSRFESEMKDVIKNYNMHSSEMKEAYLKKAKKMIKEIQADLIELKKVV